MAPRGYHFRNRRSEGFASNVCSYHIDLGQAEDTVFSIYATFRRPTCKRLQSLSHYTGPFALLSRKARSCNGSFEWRRRNPCHFPRTCLVILSYSPTNASRLPDGL